MISVSPVGAVEVDELLQFSVQDGGAGGNGTSPALTVADRQIASREIAIVLLIV
jgi:hypothetical protein